MTKRIFRSIFLVALTVLLVTMALVMGAVHRRFTQMQTEQLRTETALAAHVLENQGLEALNTLDPSFRITWIAADGSVLFDNRTDEGTMPSHQARREVAQAMDQGFGQSVRYSDTLLERYVYAAQRLSDGTVLRLAVSQASALSLALDMGQYMVVILMAAGLLIMLLSRRLARSVVQPINDLDLEDPLSGQVYEEITPLLRRLEDQQAQIRGQKQELKRRQKEFNTVTRSLSEGLVLLNAQGTILSINPAAARLLDVTENCLGADFAVANRQEAIARLVEQALAGEKGERTLELGEGTYLAAASPVRSEGAVFGVVLLLFDVTQKQRAEALRREFTANVSHELKTPLHAILGYSELMKSGMTPPQDIPGFSEKIYAQARRLLALVEDTLRLSGMDEGTLDLQRSELDLFAVVRQTAAELTGPAELGQVRLEIQGEKTLITAIPQLVSAIVFNLAENAVKYSRPEGLVRLRVESRDHRAILTVEDRGIGIPEADRERVFERFYRVDKSHSREIGGTGLGLSIVKHAAAILGAEVKLESELNVGTTVTVAFPQ
ncbi:MAG: ATP-binding protein [Eubacteriales bacterium]|nr:ATP-binding protein [Eubacteriales bacterium]